MVMVIKGGGILFTVVGSWLLMVLLIAGVPSSFAHIGTVSSVASPSEFEAAASTIPVPKKKYAQRRLKPKTKNKKTKVSKHMSAPSVLTKNHTCPDPNQGGIFFPVPVILNVTILKFPEHNEYYERMIIQGYNYSDPDPACHAGDLAFVAQQEFWYLEVFPLSASNHDCFIPNPDKLFEPYNISNMTVNAAHQSSCNLYDFRLVIFNNLEESTTIHFHGLTPPSNEDGVPFVANAAIHPQNWQKYRFNANTYAGVHWMHAHTGFHEAFGVAVPIVFHHADSYYDANTDLFRREDDVIVMLEEGFIYPKCAYSQDWYHELCQNINSTDHGKLAFLINRQEEPVVVTPTPDADYIRIRILNGGSEAPWRIVGPNVTAEGGSMEVLATDGNDVKRGTFTEKFVIGLANRGDVLVKVDPHRDMLITAIQMKHSGPVENPALRYIVIRGTTVSNGEKIRINDLPTYDKNTTSPILKNFNLMANLTAEHALVKRKITRSFTVINQGGDQYGGFPLTIYDGLLNNDGNPTDGTRKEDQLPRTGKVHNYTQLNHLKFQLPPYKVYRHNKTKDKFISTRRPCAGCVTGHYNKSGIRNRPQGKDYDVWDSASFYAEADVANNDTCCWEWCDVEPDQCDFYKLEDVKHYEPNKNYIPVCYGDRVRILFINFGSFEKSEGHPMHLHGHDFVLRELYNVTTSNTSTNNILLTQEDTDDLNYAQAKFKLTGPKVDTIWVPYNQALAFDFDAYNPGEHLFHCHNDFHLENGMMTTIRYMDDDYCKSSTRPKFKGGTNKYPTQFCSMGNCQPSTLSNNSKEEL